MDQSFKEALSQERTRGVLEEELRTLQEKQAVVSIPAERMRGILVFQGLRPVGIS